MADDIARLGLAIDSRPVAALNKELTALKSASAVAERAVEGLSGATDKASKYIGGFGGGLTQGGKQALAYAEALKKAGGARREAFSGDLPSLPAIPPLPSMVPPKAKDDFDALNRKINEAVANGLRFRAVIADATEAAPSAVSAAVAKVGAVQQMLANASHGTADIIQKSNKTITDGMMGIIPVAGQVEAKIKEIAASAVRFQTVISNASGAAPTAINAAVAKVGAVQQMLANASAGTASIIQKHNKEVLDGMMGIVPVAGKASAALSAVGEQAQRAGNRFGLASHHMSNLSFQINDVVSGIIMGQSPFQILAQQGGQFFQIAQQSEGGLKGIGRSLLSLITPARLAVGGLLGIGTTAVIAANQWGDSQRKIEMALLGIGRASGMTPGKINEIAGATATPTGLSVGEARDAATEFAKTGRIGAQAIQSLTGMTKDFARIMGVDAAEAAKLLAKAFSDPAQGAVELNQRLGSLSAATLRHIANLQAQNRIYEAHEVLLRAVKDGLKGVDDAVSGSEKFWTSLGNKIAYAWEQFSKFASRTTGIGFTQGLEEKLTLSAEQIKKLERSLEPEMGLGPKNRAINLADLDAERKKYQDLKKSIEEVNSEVKERQGNLDSVPQAAAVGRQMPELGQKEALLNEWRAMELILQQVNVTGGATSPMLARMDKTLGQVKFAASAAKEAYEKFIPEIERAARSTEQEVEALDQRSIADRRAQAERRTRQELERQGRADSDEGLRLIKVSGDLAAGGQTALDQVTRQHISTLGDLASVSQVVAARRLELIDLARQGITFTTTERANILLLARVQTEMSRIQSQANVGVFDEIKARQAAANQMQSWIALKLIDKNNTEQVTGANIAQAKSLERIRDSAKIAASPLEELTRMGIEASKLNKNFDQFAAGGLRSFEEALVDVASGTKSLADAFKNMADSIIKDLLRMMIRQNITGPLAGLLDSSMRGFFGTASAWSPTGQTYASGIGPTPSGLPLARGGLVQASVENSRRPLRYATGGIVRAYAPGGLIGMAIDHARRGPIAARGLVRGPGTGTSDSIPAMLPRRSFVVNARATANHLSLLEAINRHSAVGNALQRTGTVAGGVPAMVSNREFIVDPAATSKHLPLLEMINSNRLPRLAAGGLVERPPMPVFPAAAAWAQGGANVKVTSNVHNYAGHPGVEQKVTNHGDGNISIDTFLPMIDDALAQRAVRQHSSFAKVMGGPDSRVLKGA